MKIKKFNEAKQKQEDYYLTVGKLIDILKKFDPDLMVGRNGHFGEFHPMTIYDFHEDTSRFNANKSWRYLDFYKDAIKVITMDVPDIGEAPD